MQSLQALTRPVGYFVVYVILWCTRSSSYPSRSDFKILTRLGRSQFDVNYLGNGAFRQSRERLAQRCQGASKGSPEGSLGHQARGCRRELGLRLRLV
jgi:hypothetical protein